MNNGFFPYYGYNMAPTIARSSIPMVNSIPTTALAAGRSTFSFNSLLNGASRTLNVINQAIPVINQAKPVWNNMKTMFRVAKEINKPDTKSSKTNIVKNTQDPNGPNFFI